MSTLRQIEANRRNALKSTGPTSVAGKAAYSMNALKSGLHAESLVLPSEDPADLAELTEAYYAHYRPASPIARALVDDLVRCEWTLRRLDAAESQAWQYQNHDIYRDPEKFPLGKSVTCNPNSFSKLQYRLDATRRARCRALEALEKLKAEPAPAPPIEPGPPDSLDSLGSLDSLFPIGFVPSTPTATPPEVLHASACQPAEGRSCLHSAVPFDPPHGKPGVPAA